MHWMMKCASNNQNFPIYNHVSKYLWTLAPVTQTNSEDPWGSGHTWSQTQWGTVWQPKQMKRNCILYLGLSENVKGEPRHKPQPDFSKHRFLFANCCHLKTPPDPLSHQPPRPSPQPPYHKKYLFFPPLPIIFLLFMLPLCFPFLRPTFCFRQESFPATYNSVSLFIHPPPFFFTLKSLEVTELRNTQLCLTWGWRKEVKKARTLTHF